MFYKAVQKYKMVQSKQRIKLGTEIIETFITKNSEKEVNIRGSTRTEILSIISITKRMNDHKDKYKALISLVNDQNNAKQEVKDIVYSMGFTEGLFDKAFDEIFYLMKTNSWVPFRNTIIGYVNNDNFSKQQEIKLIHQRDEHRKQLELIKNVHLLTKMNEDKRRKSVNCDSKESEPKKKVTMKDILNGYQPKSVLQDDDDAESDSDSDEVDVEKLQIHASLKKNVGYSRSLNKHRESIQNVYDESSIEDQKSNKFEPTLPPISAGPGLPSSQTSFYDNYGTPCGTPTGKGKPMLSPTVSTEDDDDMIDII